MTNLEYKKEKEIQFRHWLEQTEFMINQIVDSCLTKQDKNELFELLFLKIVKKQT